MSATSEKLTILKKDAQLVFKTLGYEGASTWSTQRIQNKLANLPEKMEEEESKRVYEEASVMLRETIDNLIDAVKAGVDVDIVDSTASNGKVEKGASKKAGKKPLPTTKEEAKAATKKESKKTTTKKEGIERDKYGSRIGTETAKANAVLSSTPKTESQIRKEAGIKNTVEYHLDKLVRLGILKWKKDAGYFLPDKKSK